MKQRELLEETVGIYLAANPDLFLVDISISKENEIEVVIESEKGSVSMDQCVDLSRRINDALDRDVEDYALTVGSAGLSSPFKVLGQYRKAIGTQVQITRKSGGWIKASLLAVDDEGITVMHGDSEESIPFAQIKSVKQVIKF